MQGFISALHLWTCLQKVPTFLPHIPWKSTWLCRQIMEREWTSPDSRVSLPMRISQKGLQHSSINGAHLFRNAFASRPTWSLNVLRMPVSYPYSFQYKMSCFHLSVSRRTLPTAIKWKMQLLTNGRAVSLAENVFRLDALHTGWSTRRICQHVVVPFSAWLTA